MAKVVMMRHPATGLMRKGYVGFSWTTWIFGGFPAIFRGDIVIGLCMIVLQWFTFGIGTLIWAFVYNRQYTIRLVEKGYRFADSESLNALAHARLNVVPL
jgi:hypothetical protein